MLHQPTGIPAIPALDNFPVPDARKGHARDDGIFVRRFEAEVIAPVRHSGRPPDGDLVIFRDDVIDFYLNVRKRPSKLVEKGLKSRRPLERGVWIRKTPHHTLWVHHLGNRAGP